MKRELDTIFNNMNQIKEKLKVYEKDFTKLGCKPFSECGLSETIAMANIIMGRRENIWVVFRETIDELLVDIDALDKLSDDQVCAFAIKEGVPWDPCEFVFENGFWVVRLLK